MGKDNVANCDQEPRATVAPSDQSEAGLTVSGLSLGQVGQPTNGPPPMGYVAEHQANERQANEHHEEPNRRG